MAFNYPISLNIAGKKCLVIGGGNVAFRKVNTLLESGGTVLVISSQISTEMQKLADNRKISWIGREINYRLFKNCFLVIAATNSRDINQQIANYCHDNSILVNVVDSLEESSFIVNSCIKQGDLTIAISTNGKSPALASKIKDDLKNNFGPEYALLLEVLAEARELAKKNITDEKKRNQFFREIVKTEILQVIKESGPEEALERVKTCLLSY